MTAEAGAERRRQRRQERLERLFVQAQLPASGTTGTRYCATRNVSPGGLCVRSETAIEPGASIECWVRVAGCDGTFLLRGVARWLAPVEEGRGFLIGLQLMPAPHTDYARWQRLFADDPVASVNTTDALETAATA